MQWKTHLAIGLGVALLFATHVANSVFFIIITLIATLFPDIDSSFSYMGKNPVAKPVQMTTNHRGIVHSYTLCLALSLLLVFIYPFAALPFFLGYSFHLFADSFTPQGIKPFWPIKSVSKGPIKSGGLTDRIIFYVISIADIVIIATMIYGMF